MIKTIYLVGLLTGLGYIASTAFSFLLVRIAPGTVVQEVVRLESIILTVTSLAAFGVQPHATRMIAKSVEWKKHFRIAQSSKLSAGILITTVFLVLYGLGFGNIYLYLILSPLFAIGAEYALYALGYPVSAAIVSFIRNGGAYLILIVVLLVWPQWINSGVFIVVLALGAVLALMLGRLYLKTSVVGSLSLTAIGGYLVHFKIGAGNFLIEYMRPLSLLVGSIYLSVDELEVYYPLVKVYLIYIGVRRLVVNAVYKEIRDPRKSLMIDRTFIIIGAVFLVLFISFNYTFTQKIFPSNPMLANDVIVMFGLCILASSLFLTSGPKIQLAGLDDAFFFANLAAFLVFTITIGIVVGIDGGAVMLVGCLFLGELTSAVLLKVVVASHFK